MSAGGEQKLSNIGMLETLPADQLTKLEGIAKWRNYSGHEQIIDRDSDSRDVYFVTRGRVRVVNFSYSGREVSYDEIVEGGVFGELAAIDEAPRSANVIALKDTTVASVSPAQFQQLLADNPEFALSIMRRLVQIVRGSTDRIMDLSTLGAYNRVYAELLRLAREAEEDEDGKAVIKPAPIHSNVASRSGTTRETVARALSDLSRKDIVKRDGDNLAILDMWELEEIVEGHGDA